MQCAFGPPAAIVATSIILGALLGGVLPTCLYLYVEPRGRLSWGVAGDTRITRRAPIIVRFTAWLSFAVGQLALPWLLLPVACAVLLYVQAKLGVGRSVGFAATVMVGAMAVMQSLLAFRLLPLGIRLLVRDAQMVPRLARVARRNALANGLLLGLGVVVSWAMASAPGLVHPWLSFVLSWVALRPVIAYAGAMLLHAFMLGRCEAILAEDRQTHG